MALSSITGVLSRYFLLGYWLPAFVTLFALTRFLTSEFLPDDYEKLKASTQILVLGGVALVVGLILLGLRYPTTRLLEGYPLEFGLARRLKLRTPFVRLQQRSYDRLARRRDSPADARDAANAARLLARRFHPDRNRLLPTRFGNAYRAFERYPYERWGLDMIAAWPLIEPLLNEQERELHTNAESDVAFFRNGVIGCVVVGIATLVDAIVNEPLELNSWEWSLYVLPFVFAYLVYRFAIGAAERLGTERKASVALHRLQLYETLGVRLPLSAADEKLLARAVNHLLLFGEQIELRYFKANVKGE